MKVIIILSFAYVALFSTEIRCSKKYQQVLDKMEEMAINDATINGVLKPSKGGHLGAGFYGVTFKGTLVTLEKEVAMKFTTTEHKYCVNAAENEYKIYSYLNAINNSDIEMYGIPSVYYYGRWEGYILMAITLLDSTVKVSFESKKINELDILIIFREFVRILKYIHSRGIFHKDIKLDNMMFRRNQGFIIDYNAAKLISRHAEKDERRYMKEDWNRLFYAISGALHVQINWFGFDNVVNAADNVKIFENIRIAPLRRVIIEFAKNIYEGDSFDGHGFTIRKSSITILHYDRLNETISEEINKISPSKPALVSWLKNEDETKAIQELAEIPNISSINDPFGMIEPQYSDVNFDYFYKHDLKCSASS